MTKRMLIDAAHPEETRVVILANGKIDDFEAETKGKQQLKGNIFLGRVSRVEPSLQAAFITFGGNRNGFLAFGEVHPAYFHLKADEKAQLLEELEAQAARRRGLDQEDEGSDEAASFSREASAEDALEAAANEAAETPVLALAEAAEEAGLPHASAEPLEADASATDAQPEAQPEATEEPESPRNRRGPRRVPARRPQRAVSEAAPDGDAAAEAPRPRERFDDRRGRHGGGRAGGRFQAPEGPRQPSIHRRYRIQDVLKEGQKILVQVVKEERGSKGAALTTYFSLPGRYTVLMPNTPHAGGISRKITDGAERQQLREVYAHLDVPPTMGLIIRTAGTGQPVEQIARDFNNLRSLWQGIQQKFESEDDIQCLHEDGSVIVRALRDMASEELEDIVVSGAHAYKQAKDFAKSMIPELAPLIKQHRGDTPLFQEAKVEQRLNQLHHSRVALPSGGYLVINPTEALVAIDINSGRATQERNIEETALKTNLEACDEIARQIRLRDLSGLIVVDFIDMEDRRNGRKVEQAFKRALKQDRARIQMGEISQFGLMEISRQRLRPSFGESHFVPCPHCQGTGWVHSPSTSALMILRKLEDPDVRGADKIQVFTDANTVLWILNHKRDLIRDLEARHKYQLMFMQDAELIAPDHRMELVRIKPDGSETSQSLNVTLREVPELPPELRGYGKRKRDDERPAREDDEAPRPRKAPRDERQDTEDKKESRSEAIPASPAKPARAEGQPSAGTKPGKPDKRSETKPAKPSSQTISRPQPVAKDAPLEVAKVAVSDDTPIVVPQPRKKAFEIKTQADTDAADAPLEVAKVSATDGSSAKALKQNQDPEKSSAKGGFLSRLIGG